MQKSKNNRSLPDPEWIVSSSWSDKFLQSAVMQWVVLHTRFVVVSLAIGCALFLFLGLLLHKRTARQDTELSQSSYWAAQLTDPEKLFSNEGKEVSQENPQEKRAYALKRLISLVNRFPILQTRYDGLIAQELWVRGSISEATDYAKRCVDCLNKNNLPLHAEYSAISSVIMGNQLPEALERSITLDKRIVEAMEPTSKEEPFERLNPQLQLIQSFNMLRIINLHAKLGQDEAFKEAMLRLKNMMNNRGMLSQEQQDCHSRVYSSFADHLRKGKESFLDFLSLSRQYP